MVSRREWLIRLVGAGIALAGCEGFGSKTSVGYSPELRQTVGENGVSAIDKWFRKYATTYGLGAEISRINFGMGDGTTTSGEVNFTSAALTDIENATLIELTLATVPSRPLLFSNNQSSISSVIRVNGIQGLKLLVDGGSSFDLFENGVSQALGRELKPDLPLSPIGQLSASIIRQFSSPTDVARMNQNNLALSYAALMTGNRYGAEDIDMAIGWYQRANQGEPVTGLMQEISEYRKRK